MTNDSQSRKWQLTINNPVVHGYPQDVIESVLSKMPLIYWCMSDETGEQGTYHTHVYLQSASGIRFSTILKRFEGSGAHCEMCKGTAQENRDYVFKEGKWLNSEKGTTNHKDTHREWGDLPVERQGKRNDLDDLYDMILSGMTTNEIIKDNPSYMLQIEKIEKVRQVILEDKYKDLFREMDVTYIWGLTGSGKTRGVMEKYGYSNVYRVTDYIHPFDAYRGQDVVLFEEFRSSLYIDDMLKYLDGYPVEFPARYSNRQACFSKVYFATNIDLRCQYPNIQKEQPLTWQAFLRRIHRVKVYTGSDVIEMETEKYMKEYFPFFGKTPFDDDEGGGWE